MRNWYVQTGVRLITWFLTMFVSLYVVMMVGHDGSKLVHYRSAGMFKSQLRAPHLGDSVLVFSLVDTLDYRSRPYPAVGDTLLSFDTIQISASTITAFIMPDLVVGKSLPQRILHQGDTLTVQVLPRGIKSWAFITSVIHYLLRLLVGFGFTGVAIWAMSKRSENEAARVLTLFCLAMTVYVLRGMAFLPDRFASFTLPFETFTQVVYVAIVTYLETFWLHLQLLFPRRHPFLQTHRLIKTIALYSLQTISMALIYFANPMNYAYITIYVQLVFLVQIGLGLHILWGNYQSAATVLEKRQLKLVLFGSTIGLVPLTIWLSLKTVMTLTGIVIPLVMRVMITNSVFIVLLLTPIMYAYAMGRHRLLDVEAKLRRGTGYLLVTGLLSLAVFGVVYGVSEALLSYVHVTDRTPTLAIAILLTLGIVPMQAKIQTWLERRFYPERSSLRAMFAEFLQGLVAMPDRDTLWLELKKRLREGLCVEHVVPVLRRYEVEGLQTKPSGTAPFLKESSFVSVLEREQRPVLVDELLESGRINVLPEERIWLKEKQIALILPMVVQSHLIGFIGLGFKSDQQDFTPHDMSILSSLGTQIAMAHENLRLREETLDKKRLEEQLSIARDIQLGFLPRSLPAVSGLDVAVKSVFCVEVAGDYHDMFALPDGRIALAVGDVVGKGAGAAMLMANLQASFHTAMEGSESLEEVVRRINRQIHRSTNPEQFITFFACVYDPVSRGLSYVNAGHNPPLLVRPDGTVEELFTGGVLLGTVAQASYEVGSTSLREGDWLLLYTDGMTEAMNAGEEEFGVERVVATTREHSGEDAETVVAKLHERVVAFQGREQFDDDFTLLVVKGV